jgi:Rab-GTPase-TBC domain
MLIRLLDAFVWKNQDNAEEGRMAFGYVQGMNVLAAPFLYIMPSEIEAFYTFSKFIEQCCPLYVQPTLDGVHRGLTVSKFPQHVIYAVQTIPSYWTVASKSWTRSYIHTYALRNSPRKYTPSHLSSRFVLAHHLLKKFCNFGIFC